ncbi:uncharacterized protein [Argopecten irradians]|uniref:uncharacterized protein n=1 Tax=Argopecten irradians TaxID=31199 RepID=UPI003717CC24
MRLRPSEIRFSQDSINNVFDKRSLHAYRRIGETLDDLLRGRCSISQIPTITVVQRNGVWYTTDNRRLWVFRKLEELGKCTTISVYQGYSIPSEKFTTRNSGRSIIVRRDAGGSYWRTYRYGSSRPSSVSASGYSKSKQTFWLQDSKSSDYGTRSLNNAFGHKIQYLNKPSGCGPRRLNDPFGHGTRSLNNSFGHGTRSLNNPIGHGTRSLNNSFGHGTRCLNNPFGHGTRSLNNPICHGTRSLNNPFGHGTRSLNNPICHGTRSLNNPFGHGTRSLNNPFGHGTRSMINPFGHGTRGIRV